MFSGTGLCGFEPLRQIIHGSRQRTKFVASKLLASLPVVAVGDPLDIGQQLTSGPRKEDVAQCHREQQNHRDDQRGTSNLRTPQVLGKFFGGRQRAIEGNRSHRAAANDNRSPERQMPSLLDHGAGRCRAGRRVRERKPGYGVALLGALHVALGGFLPRIRPDFGNGTLEGMTE